MKATYERVRDQTNTANSVLEINRSGGEQKNNSSQETKRVSRETEIW